jgi:hypothetical protein
MNGCMSKGIFFVHLSCSNLNNQFIYGLEEKLAIAFPKYTSEASTEIVANDAGGGRMAEVDNCKEGLLDMDLMGRSAI